MKSLSQFIISGRPVVVITEIPLPDDSRCSLNKFSHSKGKWMENHPQRGAFQIFLTEVIPEHANIEEIRSMIVVKIFDTSNEVFNVRLVVQGYIDTEKIC